MSTATSPPPRALFAGLIDDAAVFPPGNFPLGEAISRRLKRRSEPYVDLVGPTLLPPALVHEALKATTPLTICVVGRPNIPLTEVLAVAEQVASSSGHSLAGLEFAYQANWRQALDLGVPLAIEVTPDADSATLDDLAADGLEQVRAKLRTGSTPANPVPTTEQLASFITSVTDRRLSFKLTGGMHRAVSHRAATPDGGEDQFGFLNVLLATNATRRGGSPEGASALLAQRDSGAVAALIANLGADDAQATRSVFHSYGCCEVLDPIHDLSDLNLIEETL